MKFLLDNRALTFEKFQELFPDEAHLLAPLIDAPLSFLIEEKRLMLVSEGHAPVFIDMDSKLRYHQKFFQTHSYLKEPLARAIGLKKGSEKPRILDATGGFLKDSLLFFALGLEVTICERHPLAQALIANAIKNSHLIDLERFRFFPQAAENFIQNTDTAFDVIYFDPMYAIKNEKALPKKEMRIFRSLVGVDEDAHTVAMRLKNAAKRLVIKRSVKAPPLLENPHHTSEGKSTSYDVYLRSESFNFR